MPVEVVCKNCGRTFETYPAWIRRGRGKFCSKKCQSEWMSKYQRGENAPNWKGGSLTRTCKNCGNPFQIPEAWIRKGGKGAGSFCSRKCYVEYHIFETMCAFCGNSLILPMKREGHKHYFCSSICHGKWISKHLLGENSPSWKGGFDDYRGAEWNKQKKRVFDRDKHVCQTCGTKEDLIVHHIIPFKEFGLARHEEVNQLSNLITLCRGCHNKMHKSKRLFQRESDLNVLPSLPALRQPTQG